MRISQNGIDLIKEFEGCILQSYDDYNDKIINAGDTYRGTLTIGYGHIENVYPGQIISQDEADRMLSEDMVRYSEQVQEVINEGTISFPVNQNQFDALTSFDYNCGQGSLRTLCRNRDANTVADMMLEYRNKGSQWEQGLLRRRQAEWELLLNGNCEPVQACNSPIGINLKVHELQQILRDVYKNHIAWDGIWGPETEAAVHKLPLCGLPYTTPELTKWIQLRVGETVDGIFGQDTYNAVVEFQRDHNLVQDGIVGFNTLKEMALC